MDITKTADDSPTSTCNCNIGEGVIKRFDEC